MISFLFLILSCGTEVGIIGYTEKQQDTSVAETAPDDQPIEDTQPEDTQEPSSEEDLPNSGITGYVNYKLRQVACPACVGEAQEITVTFSAKFHQPSTDGHTEWIPPVGSCVDNLFTISPSIIPTSVGSSISVDAPGHSFTVPQIGNGEYQTTAIWESQYQRDTSYLVTTSLGNFSFLSSHGHDFMEPYTMLWVDPSYAYDAPVYRNSSTNFSWGPPSSNSIFMITVAVYSWDGSQFLGRVDCVGDDSGYLSIPGTYFQQFPAGSLAAIHLNRHKIELVETDINNSFIETHTEWEVVGTGHIE